MPFYAAQKSRSKAYGKKKGFAKRPSQKVTRRDVVKIAKRVTTASKPVKEVRMHTYGGLKTDFLANSFVTTDLTNIGPGDQADQRDGRKIFLAGFRYKLAFDSARSEDRYIRIMVLQAKNTNDPPDFSTWTDLYQDNTYSNRAADMLAGDITHPLNTDVFHIYMDKLIKVSSAGNDGSAKVVSGYLKLNKKLEYDNAGASSNVPVTGGQIYCVIHLCENYSTTGSTATVTNYDGFYRVFFRDT